MKGIQKVKFAYIRYFWHVGAHTFREKFQNLAFFWWFSQILTQIWNFGSFFMIFYEIFAFQPKAYRRFLHIFQEINKHHFLTKKCVFYDQNLLIMMFWISFFPKIPFNMLSIKSKKLQKLTKFQENSKKEPNSRKYIKQKLIFIICYSQKYI